MSQQPLNDLIDARGLAHHLENSPLAIIIRDNNGRIIYWSNNATEIFGWNEQEVLHRHFSEVHLGYAEDAAFVLEKLESLRSKTQPANQYVTRNVTKPGKVIYCEWFNSALIDPAGNMSSLLSMVQDITERKNAEETLVRSEQRLSLIYNSAIDPIWLINIEGENRFIFEGVNISFTTVTGLKKEEVLGLPIEEVMPAASHELVRGKYNEAIRSGEVIDYVEVAMHPAGQKVGEIRVIPVKDTNGKVTKLVGIANDITEKQSLQKQLDAERDDFNRKLTAAAVKAQEKERSNVSRELHDNVNQVLTTVKLYIELCVSGGIKGEEILPRCASLLNETIKEIRDLSTRLAVPSLGDIGLNETLRELCESVQVTKKLNIQFDTSKVTCNNIDSDLHLAVYRIVQEQLTNILKHAEAREVYIKLEIKRSFLRVTISDDGKGFDLSSTRKGIGLNNIKSRAEILNGFVNIESAVGKGSTVTADFPVFINEGKCIPLSKALG